MRRIRAFAVPTLSRFPERAEFGPLDEMAAYAAAVRRMARLDQDPLRIGPRPTLPGLVAGRAAWHVDRVGIAGGWTLWSRRAE